MVHASVLSLHAQWASALRFFSMKSISDMSLRSSWSVIWSSGGQMMIIVVEDLKRMTQTTETQEEALGSGVLCYRQDIKA